MAKITFEFDTETKKMACAVDGASVPDVRMVEVYPDWDKDDQFSCSITSKTEREDGIVEVRRLMACVAESAKASAGAFPSKDYPGLDETRSTEGDFHRDFAEAFGVK